MRPTLVFLPGSLCDSRVWRPVVDALGSATPCTVITYGEQDSIKTMASTVLAAVDGPLIPIGLSMGGIVALAMWRQAPERIVALGLCGTNPGADPIERKNARATQLAIVESDGLQALAEQRLAPAYFAADSAQRAQLTHTVTQMTLDAGKARLTAQFAALSSRSDSWPTLPTITVPTLVMFGANDMVCPPQDQQRMAAQIPRACVHEIPQAGHLAPLEQANSTAVLIREWLHLLQD